MSSVYKSAYTDLNGTVSFGSGGGGGGGGGSDRQERRNNFHRNRNAKAAERRAAAGPTWGDDFKNCIRTDDTWHGSDTPATDSVIGCAAKTTISRW